MKEKIPSWLEWIVEKIFPEKELGDVAVDVFIIILIFLFVVFMFIFHGDRPPTEYCDPGHFGQPIPTEDRLPH